MKLLHESAAKLTFLRRASDAICSTEELHAVLNITTSNIPASRHTKMRAQMKGLF
jgi:hypothetical protein